MLCVCLLSCSLLLLVDNVSDLYVYLALFVTLCTALPISWQLDFSTINYFMK
jgi:hypothetical protein